MGNRSLCCNVSSLTLQLSPLRGNGSSSLDVTDGQEVGCSLHWQPSAPPTPTDTPAPVAPSCTAARWLAVLTPSPRSATRPPWGTLAQRLRPCPAPLQVRYTGIRLVDSAGQAWSVIFQNSSSAYSSGGGGPLWQYPADQLAFCDTPTTGGARPGKHAGRPALPCLHAARAQRALLRTGSTRRAQQGPCLRLARPLQAAQPTPSGNPQRRAPLATPPPTVAYAEAAL